jgi:hypothetical protein
MAPEAIGEALSKIRQKSLAAIDSSKPIEILSSKATDVLINKKHR